MTAKTLQEARKALKAYIKLVETENIAWEKRVKAHKKELVRLAGMCVKLIGDKQ